MKFLIAGLGSIGRRHLHNLLTMGEQDILLYRTGRSSLPDEDLVGFPVETDLEAALAHHPQAVIISNPTALHLEVAIPAAKAGCHILLEKPVSNDLRGVDELLEAQQRGGGQILVGYHFRFHPGLQKIISILSAGTIGRPLSVRAHWGAYLPGWHPWEDFRQGYSARKDLGGGVILTLSHPLDYLHWMFGKVNSVWAFAGQLADLELDVEDTAEIGLQLQSSVLGSLHLDYTQQPPAHHLEVIATKGMLRWDNSDGTVHHYQAELDRWESFSPPEGFERNQLFLSEMRHFLAVARGEELPVCTLEDGVQALILSLAALQSARDGRLIRL